MTVAQRAAPGHNRPEETLITEAYRARTRRSAALAAEAQRLLPSGIAHDSRRLLPHSLYVERAEGPYKWDADGNRYIDYFGGHGALLLGHNHPKVAEAATAQLTRGTHYAACHEGEIAWARLVTEMVPSAERVRFTSSGTEAMQMAVRLARAFTGRARILRFFGHFHGWADDATTGYASHFDGTPVTGVPKGVAANAVVMEANDLAAVEAALERRDIAAVIVEGIGGGTGMAPLQPGFLEGLRRMTAKAGSLMILDEVVTGFRVSPGGIQAVVGVKPDLTTLAKILAGGLPGGAVAGREDILAHLDFDRMAEKGREKIYHPGTFNAGPLSAASGIAALTIIKEGDACERAARLAANLRDGLNAVLARTKVPWAAYGQSSAVHIFMGGAGWTVDPLDFDPLNLSRAELTARPAEPLRQLRLAMMVNGVDISGWPGGLLSAAHQERDIAETLAAFEASLDMMKQVGMV